MIDKLLQQDSEAIKKLPRKDRLLCDAVWMAANAMIRADPTGTNALARRRVFDQYRPLLDRIVAQVDVNTVPTDRETALCQALSLGDGKQLVEYLAECGADVNLDPNGGGTPLSRARRLGRHEEAEVLLRYGAHE